MKRSHLHIKLGFVMAAPLLLWIITGFVFLTKPGYEQAYEQITPRYYPVTESITVPSSAQWSEVKLVHTVLGHHLLVVANNEPMQLDPETFARLAMPVADDLFRLIDDATGHNRERYGQAVSVSGNEVMTDTGVVVTIDWSTLKLRQQGTDSRVLNTLYKIHYLQWLGHPMVNKVFGALGLLLLATLVLLGLYYSTKSSDRSS